MAEVLLNSGENIALEALLIEVQLSGYRERSSRKLAFREQTIPRRRKVNYALGLFSQRPCSFEHDKGAGARMNSGPDLTLL